MGLVLSCHTIKKAFEEILGLPDEYDSKAVIILGESKDIVKLVDSKDEEDTKYFVKDGIHHVPKLKLGDLILAKKIIIKELLH